MVFANLYTPGMQMSPSLEMGSLQMTVSLNEATLEQRIGGPQSNVFDILLNKGRFGHEETNQGKAIQGWRQMQRMLSNTGCWKEDRKDPRLPSRDKVDTDIVSDYELQAFDLINFGFLSPCLWSFLTATLRK